MKRLVLQDFHYARDGRNATLLRAGKTADILPEHVDRFVAEGKIERRSSDAAANADAIEIDVDTFVDGDGVIRAKVAAVSRKRKRK